MKYPFTLLTATTILVLSLMPTEEMPEVDVPLIDKWVHFVMYGSLSAVAWWEYLRRTFKHGQSPFRWTTVLTLCFLLPAAWGGLMELAQAYLTTCRTGDWWDFVANTIGAALASAAGAAWCCIKAQKV